MRRGRATAPVAPEDVADAAIGRFLDYRDRGHDEATARTWALWDIHENPDLERPFAYRHYPAGRHEERFSPGAPLLSGGLAPPSTGSTDSIPPPREAAP
jgi:hypothetical protein